MHKFIIIIMLMGICIPTLHAQKETVEFPKLSKEINAMRGPDQKFRIKWMKLRSAGKKEKADKLGKKLLMIDRNNTARLREIIAEIGWPTIKKVGRRASDTAWLIAQHADRRPLFQRYCLGLLKEAVDNQDAKPSNYAYLYDRVQLAWGDKQYYATQSSYNAYTEKGFFQAIEDESKVDLRREEMEIGYTAAAYAEDLGFTYALPDETEAQQRSEAFATAYDEFIRLAKAATEKGDHATAADNYIQAMYSDGSVKAEDLVAGARALSLSKHKSSSRGWYFLLKAALRGWPHIDQYDTDPDFAHLKSTNPISREDLMTNVKEIQEKD